MIDLKVKLAKYRCEKLRVLNVGGGGAAVIGLPPQLREIKFKQLDHLDIYEPSLNKCKGVPWAAETVNFILCDIREFDFSGYDLLLMFDVIEHLPKDDA
jgi:2-polyprenyl-3-methyl-5-hydroxy-6-metoxy-1,4-benzoquinol methylase